VGAREGGLRVRRTSARGAGMGSSIVEDLAEKGAVVRGSENEFVRGLRRHAARGLAPDCQGLCCSADECRDRELVGASFVGMDAHQPRGS